MSVELIAGLEASRLIRRDPVKYARGVTGMYLLTAKGCELGQIARSSFFFLRNQDDALDGDRPDIEKPLAHVLDCRNQIETGIYTGKPKVVQLAQFAISKLQSRSKQGDDPRQDFLNEIDIMLFDYYRSRQRKALTTDELNDYYRATFFPVINLMLIGINSGIRVVDIEELAYCQGRVYSVRDLDTDWERGVINIPREVLEQGELTTQSPIKTVRSSVVVKDWFVSELNKCQQDLPVLQAKLGKLDESLTIRMCKGLASPLQRLSTEYLAEFS